MHVRGAGPVPCSLAIVGPHPGPMEDQTGIPFSPGKISASGRVWRTGGDELNRLLDGKTLPDRNHVYLTNLHKEYRGKDYVYSKEDVDQAWPVLQRELEKVQPATIVTMGREVTRLFLGDVDITDVESIPWVDPSNPERTIFAMVHIVAGMRNSDLSPYVIRGFSELAAFLRGEIQARKLFDDPYPQTDYRLLTRDEVCLALPDL